MKYKVVLERSEEGVSAHVPGLPGCWSQGTDDADALENIKVAIQEYLKTVTDLTEGGIVRDAGLTPAEFRKLL